MSIVKSFSVGNGDTFYIKHGSDNFTIIDCCLDDNNKKRIVDELKSESKDKGITRFISTHPDDDHISGLVYLDEKMNLVNFYCVKNEATKEDETDDFTKYCELRDSTEKAFHIEKGCKRRWMNDSDEVRKSSGINILWPDTSNSDYKEALKSAKEGESPNNISPIITYTMNEGVEIVWMGDLETEFMENIIDKVSFSKTNILFAPHHGRDTGKVPEKWLKKMSPQIIVIGEAPSKDLNYYQGYNTITQNSAGDITFDCDGKKVHIYVSEDDYSVDFLDNENMSAYDNYIGTLNL
jgi:beta-lactamase superfamily II metal-dependent hydrolase